MATIVGDTESSLEMELASPRFSNESNFEEAEYEDEADDDDDDDDDDDENVDDERHRAKHAKRMQDNLRREHKYGFRVVAYVNSKSGGKQGKAVLRKLRKRLPADQVTLGRSVCVLPVASSYRGRGQMD
jgi:hypothetical protein